MSKVKDYILNFKGLWEDKGKCRIRIFQKENAPTIFICTEVSDNEGGSISILNDWLAPMVWKREGSPKEFVWIEHIPQGVSGSEQDTFSIVTFGRSMEFEMERWLFPSWTPISLSEVEDLVGNPIA